MKVEVLRIGSDGVAQPPLLQPRLLAGVVAEKFLFDTAESELGLGAGASRASLTPPDPFPCPSNQVLMWCLSMIERSKASQSMLLRRALWFALLMASPGLDAARAWSLFWFLIPIGQVWARQFENQ